MPIYEYRCKSCGKEFEYMQSIKADALTKCPSNVCEQMHKGDGEVERLISKNVGLIFNGSGFYLTDYAKKSSSSASKAPKTESTAPASAPAHKCSGGCCS